MLVFEIRICQMSVGVSRSRAQPVIARSAKEMSGGAKYAHFCDILELVLSYCNSNDELSVLEKV